MLLSLPVCNILPATPRSRIVQLDLRGRSFPYEAGQAVLVGRPDDPKRRLYSLAGAPEDACRHGFLELLMGIDSGIGSITSFSKGQSHLDIEGPVGQFTMPRNLVPGSLTFVAGGTGIAPLRSMLRHAVVRRRREIRLLYSARTAEEFAYEEELRSMARDGHIELQLTITRGNRPDAWSGGFGRIGRADVQPLVRDPATLCFLCGPLTFVSEMSRLLEDLGVAAERIKMEAYVVRMLQLLKERGRELSA